MNRLEKIAEKIRSGERIAPDEALVLWHEAPSGCWGSWPRNASAA